MSLVNNPFAVVLVKYYEFLLRMGIKNIRLHPTGPNDFFMPKDAE